MQPAKGGSNIKITGNRPAMRQKLAILNRYDAGMQEGQNREELLNKLADDLHVDVRHVERHIQKAREFKSKLEDEKDRLSIAATAICNNLQKCSDPMNSWNDVDRIGNIVYGGTLVWISQSPLDSEQLERVDKDVAMDLLSKLRRRIRELSDISDWVDLPYDRITKVFIERIRRAASEITRA